MKKKIKIFSTIASLCLAVALMAFGVYAATQITFTTSSTITFTATEIEGTWNLKIQGGDYTAEKSAAEGGGGYFNGKDVVVSDIEDHRGAVATDTVTIPSIALKDGESVAYTVTFTNAAEKSAYVNLEAEVTKESVGFELSEVTAEGWEGDYVEVEGGESIVFTFSVSLDTEVEGFERGKDSSFIISITADALAENPNA